MPIRSYVRDGRAPIPESEVTSRIMSAIKGINTKPELKFRKALNIYNVRGYKLHYKQIPGKPDICFTKKKLAVFIHGCFWHRCPYCKPHKPKTHTEYWENKFSNNVSRDIRIKRALHKIGWRYVTIWECQINKSSFMVEKQLVKTLTF